MKRKEVRELKDKNLMELGKLLDETRNKLIKLRMEKRNEKMKNVRAIARTRDDIAKILTAIKEKENREASL